MPRAAKRKEHLLSMRLPEADIAIIDRAAKLRGAHARTSCATRQYERPRMR
jgi:tRNA U38,U39,U40 pseudouridine synthase TruA